MSPTFIQLYRDGGLRLEQLEALAISNDHDAQERVWHAAHEWERTPSALRRALTVSTVDAADKRVLFVGLDSYLQRGGGLERDLFDAEHDGFLTDVNLLETLVTEKLQAEADKLKADGWSWVEVNRTEDRWRAVRTYQQLRPKSVSLSDKLQEWREAIPLPSWKSACGLTAERGEGGYRVKGHAPLVSIRTKGKI